jgi:tetratricopeptide (TPR) repeat protein
MAQAMGMKCPVCQSELQADVQVVESADKTIESGPWVDWPTPISLPLCEYFEEEHPGAKLWAACDAFEMLTRLLVIALVGSRAKGGELEDGLRDRLSRLIESPTFGAWYVMARELSDVKGFSEDLSAARDFVLGSLKDLLYGPDNPGTDETSFLKLRNRLAHGGGMTRKEQSRLLDLWQERVEETIDQLEWMSVWELLGRSENGEWKKLTGNEQETIPAPDGVGDTESDSVWLRVNNSLYPLWPLAAFGKPSIQGEGKQKKGSTEATQVYSRKESVRLGYVPLGVEGMGHAESSSSALAAFEYMFRPSEKAQASSFKIKDFMGEIRKDAGQMVGRQKELDDIISRVRETRQGVLWISGQAGMGKSFLMAKLSVDLLDEFSESGPLVLSYRMRAGDQDRCSRDALADFIAERLEGAGLMHEDIKINLQDKAEKRLETCLGGLTKDAQVVLVVDGLDEVSRRDGKFTEEVPLALRYPGVLWICSGRPEPMITEPIRKLGGEDLFPHGLPPMREEDVRGMILEKIGPLRKKLLGKDAEQDGKVINPFIRLVTERAAGLPLYVKYVIGDVLGGKYRVLDGEEDLPDSLHAYHEELLRRLGVGDLQAVVTPLAATLATAYEPLSVRELVAILVCRKLLTEEGARQMVEKGLAAIASMVRSAPDPEGEVGYCLFHQSLRDHMTGSDQMTHSIATAREAFADMAEQEKDQVPVSHLPSLWKEGEPVNEEAWRWYFRNSQKPEVLRNYFIRCGIRHLLDCDRKDRAKELLLDLDYLYELKNQGVSQSFVLRSWNDLGGEKKAKHYVNEVKELMAIGWVDVIQDRLMHLSSYLDAFQWDLLSIDINELILSNCFNPNHEPEITSLCAYHLGRAYWRDDNYEKAILNLEKSCRLEMAFFSNWYEDGTSINSLKASLIQHEIGALHCDNDNFGKAIEFHENALGYRFQKNRLPSDHIAIAESYDYFGKTFRAQKDFSRSLKYFRKSLEIRMRSLDPSDVRIASSYIEIGSVKAEQGNFEEGIDFLVKGMDILKTSGNSSSFQLVECYQEIALVAKEMGNYYMMLRYFDSALQLCERITGAGDRFLSICSAFGANLDECGEKLLSNEYFQLGSAGSKINRHRKKRFRNLNSTNYHDLVLEEEKNLIDWLSNRKNAYNKGILDAIKSWRSYCDENTEEVNPLLEMHLGRVDRLTTVSADFHEEPDTEYQKHFDQLRESVKKGEITAEEARAQTNEAKLDVLSSFFKGDSGKSDMKKRIVEAEKKALKKMKSKDKKKRLDDLKGFFE